MQLSHHLWACICPLPVFRFFGWLGTCSGQDWETGVGAFHPADDSAQLRLGAQWLDATHGTFKWGRVYCVYEKKPQERPLQSYSRHHKSHLSESSVFAEVIRNGEACMGPKASVDKLLM